jgi:hypothetical protein
MCGALSAEAAAQVAAPCPVVMPVVQRALLLAFSQQYQFLGEFDHFLPPLLDEHAGKSL